MQANMLVLHFQAFSLVLDQVPLSLVRAFFLELICIGHLCHLLHPSLQIPISDLSLSPSISIAAADDDLFFPMLIIVYGRSVVMAASSIPSPALCQFDLNRMNPDYAETL